MVDGKRNVLLVADVSPLQASGGSARVVREQALGLSERGHSVQVLCRSPHEDLLSGNALDGVPLSHYSVDRRHSLSYASTSIRGARAFFHEHLRNQDWDAVVFHQPLSAWGVQPLLPPGVARLYCFHSPAGTEYRLRAIDPRTGIAPTGTGLVAALLRTLEGRALKNSDGILVLSDFSRKLLETTHRSFTAPVRTIPGGVDLDRFQPASDRAAVRDELGLPRDVSLLLTVRDLEQRMGIDTLLRSLRQLPPERPYHCLVGGTGPLRPYLEELTRELGLVERVTFLGYVPEDQLSLYYQAADLFVLPTRSHEGFGLVTVEALACGTPVVATPAGATPEILLPLEPRLVAADAGESALASTLVEALPLVSDDELRRRCRAHAEANFSWGRHVEALEDALVTARTSRSPQLSTTR